VVARGYADRRHCQRATGAPERVLCPVTRRAERSLFRVRNVAATRCNAASRRRVLRSRRWQSSARWSAGPSASEEAAHRMPASVERSAQSTDTGMRRGWQEGYHSSGI